MIFLLLLGAGRSYAQDDTLLDRLYEKFADSCVELEYSYTSKISGVNITGQGKLQIQGNMWHNEGNGVDIWCDGKTLWTADLAAEEVVIDAVSDAPEEDLTNPALMFVHMKDLFNLKQVVESADGKAYIFILEPIHEMDIDFFNVEILKSDASIRSGSFALSDGNKFNVKVSSMKQIQKKPATSFKPSQTFDSSWIVTDLR
jgi:hypothetical protein